MKSDRIIATKKTKKCKCLVSRCGNLNKLQPAANLMGLFGDERDKVCVGHVLPAGNTGPVEEK